MNTFIPYIAVAFSYIASPGPAVFLVISNAIRYGFKKSILTVLGNSTGLAFLALLFSLGVTELLNKFPMLISTMRIIGAVYLGYLGLKSIGLINGLKKKQKIIVDATTESSVSFFFKQGFFLAATNPKPILFFAAIFPQFLSKEEPLHQQFFVLSAIFICLSFCTLNLYGIASSLAQDILTKGKAKKILDMVLGLLLLCMSIFMLYDTLFKG